MRTQNCYKSDAEIQWVRPETRAARASYRRARSPGLNNTEIAAHLLLAPTKLRSQLGSETAIHLVDTCATIEIILLPAFDAHNLSAITDALSTANRFDMRRRYAWRLIGLDGTSTMSSSGFEVNSVGTLSDISGKANIAIIGSCTSATEEFPQLAGFLRYQSRLGSNLIGVGSGAAALAGAGVADHRKVAATCRVRQVWREIYPKTDFADAIFAVDDRLITTPGGRATIHVAMAIVKQVSGPEIAHKVADALNLSSAFDFAEPQTLPANGVNTRRTDILSRALAKMLDNLEQPISTDELSRQLKISTRQLQRIFKARLKMNPRAYYLACRLDYARDLIQQTGMSVTNAAVAAGFISLSHFSKCYRRRFGTHPRNDR